MDALIFVYKNCHLNCSKITPYLHNSRRLASLDSMSSGELTQNMYPVIPLSVRLIKKATWDKNHHYWICSPSQALPHPGLAAQPFLGDSHLSWIRDMCLLEVSNPHKEGICTVPCHSPEQLGTHLPISVHSSSLWTVFHIGLILNINPVHYVFFL